MSKKASEKDQVSTQLFYHKGELCLFSTILPMASIVEQEMPGCMKFLIRSWLMLPDFKFQDRVASQHSLLESRGVPRVLSRFAQNLKANDLA